MFTFEASVFSIWYKSWGTKLANRFVIFHRTGRVFGTTRCQTWIFASERSTSLIRWTSVVSQTDRQRRTTVLKTNANGFVVHDIAALFRWTGGFRRAGARILAPPLNTSLIRRTFVVPRAFRILGGASDLSPFVHNEPVLAHARGSVVVHLAFLIASTFEQWIFARIVAFSGGGITSERGRTIGVESTNSGNGRSGLSGKTFRIWMASSAGAAHVTFRTRTPRSVHYCLTEGIEAARAS